VTSLILVLLPLIGNTAGDWGIWKGPPMTIWKFPLRMTDKQQITMPAGAAILSVRRNEQNCSYGR
jgi:hypothetical protein